MTPDNSINDDERKLFERADETTQRSNAIPDVPPAPQNQRDPVPIDLRTTRLIGTGDKPIVVFFGPSNAGKTVTLLRTILYMQEELRYTYRKSDSVPDTPHFNSVARRFSNAISSMRTSSSVPPATAGIDFLMLDVYDRSDNRLFHMLEAPGEHYFTPGEEPIPYPPYLQQIFTSHSQKKIYVFFFEKSMFGNNDHSMTYRADYSRKLSDFLSRYYRQGDKVIILYNKVNNIGRNSNPRNLRNELRNEVTQNTGSYADFALKIQNMSQGLGNVPFVTFTSGSFEASGFWEIESDEYPRELCRAIDNMINGSSIFTRFGF